MKELRREFNMRVTMITRAEDDLVDQTILDARKEESRRAYANMFKVVLGADDVQITGIKDFEADVEEE